MKRKVLLGALAAIALLAGGVLVFGLRTGQGLAAPPPTPQAGTQTFDPADCPMFGGDIQSMQQHMDQVHGAGAWDQRHGPNGIAPFNPSNLTPGPAATPGSGYGYGGMMGPRGMFRQ